MVSAFHQPIVTRGKRALGLCAVAFVHVAIFVLAYRARALTHSALWSSDLLVFALPALLACVGYAFFLRSGNMSWLTASIISIGLAFLSFWLGMIVAFNTYGT